MFGFKLETRDKGFLLELNQVEKDPIPELPPFPVPSVKTKMCIFIDDNEGALKFYARIAKALGVDALLARNVEEARELSLSQDSVSLVISDYELPDGNGLEITGFFDLERIPMIFVTGRSEKSLEHEILERGAKELLVKPISQKILIERLKQYLNL
jgi:DNA-binding response OmpR family regulator